MSNNTGSGNPSIEVAGGEQFVRREKAQKSLRKTKKEREALFDILSKIFTSSLSDNALPLNIKPLKNALDTTSKIFPQFAPGKDKLVLSNSFAQICIEQKRIAFEAVDQKQNTKPAFTAESAFAMALLASTNPLMIKQGIKLRGNAQAQALLRTAIDEVNEQLPEGQKLKIRDENIAPAINVAAKSENDNTADTVKPNATAPTKAVKGAKVLSRRGFLTGAAASAAFAVTIGTTKEAEAAKSPNYYKQKMDSGLYNPDMTLKSEKRKKSTKKENPAAQKNKEKAKLERDSARKKKEKTLKEADKKPTAQKKTVDANNVKTRPVRIVCTHTGTSANLNFKNPRSCQGAFNRVTKDWREGVTYKMAPGLITLLGRITKDLRARGHKVSQIDIVAGFRTEATNKMLIAASKKRNGGKSGVARNSWHRKGMALDFQIAGISNDKLSDTAKRVGAWSYSAGDFVHMDTRGSYTI